MLANNAADALQLHGDMGDFSRKRHGKGNRHIVSQSQRGCNEQAVSTHARCLPLREPFDSCRTLPPNLDWKFHWDPGASTNSFLSKAHFAHLQFIYRDFGTTALHLFLVFHGVIEVLFNRTRGLPSVHGPFDPFYPAWQAPKSYGYHSSSYHCCHLFSRN